MTAKSLLAIATVAAAFCATAQAGEADYASNLPQFQGQRTRAEVNVDAVWAAQNRNPEPAGSRIAAPLKSGVTAQAVRADAAQAVRMGQISHGEATL